MAKSDDLERQIEEWIAPTIAALKETERRRLAAKIGLALAKSNRDRIKAQVDPEGRRFKPRKEKKVISKPVKFLYGKPGGGDSRVAAMKSFRDEGDRMIGYDTEASGIRTFLKRRIRFYMPPPAGGGGGASRLRGRQGGIKRKAMFSKIRSAKKLRMTNVSADSVAVGFVNNVAAIAETHQSGSRLRMEHHGASANYPERRLLGLSEADVEMIRDMMIDHVAGAGKKKR